MPWRMNGSVLLGSLGRNVLSGFRLALFMPVSRTDFRIGAEHFAVLAVFNLLVWVAASYVRASPGAEFVPEALPDLLAYIPVSLLFCLIAAHLLRDGSLLAVFAVMLASTDLLFEITGTLVFLSIGQGWLLPRWQFAVYMLYVLWAIAVVLRTEFRLVSARAPGARVTAGLLVAMVLLLVYMPRDEPWAPPRAEQAQAGPLQEELFHLQGELLDRELDRLSVQRNGVADLYFLGAAPYSRQETFVRELAVVRKLLDEGYDTQGRSIALMNHASTLGAVPIATASNLRAALGRLGETLNVEEDVLMLFITTHGSAQHELAFELAPLQLRQLGPTALARMLADSGIKWKIIVLSACYAGGFIESLKDDNTLILTAADATHASFGCEASSDFTWFSRAYFDEALREEVKQGRYSFTGAFERAQAAIAEREQAAGYPASHPQLYIGAAMREKLKILEARLAKSATVRPKQGDATGAAPNASP